MKPRPLPIWQIFHPQEIAVLRTPTKPIDLALLASKETQVLIDRMVVTMRKADGVGLAATQIGRELRIAVINGAVIDQKPPIVIVNPKITRRSSRQEDQEEGCLSIPGVYGLVSRSAEISVTAYDRKGQQLAIGAQDLYARVIQHEIDHLDGVLFIDRTNRFTVGEELLP